MPLARAVRCGCVPEWGFVRDAYEPDRHDNACIFFGAICPARAVGAAVIMPTVKRECMSARLAEIGVQVAPGTIARQCDWSYRARALGWAFPRVWHTIGSQSR